MAARHTCGTDSDVELSTVPTTDKFQCLPLILCGSHVAVNWMAAISDSLVVCYITACTMLSDRLQFLSRFQVKLCCFI